MYDRDNVFAKILRRELPADIVYEDERAIAVKDIRPVAAVHVLVIPKKESVSFDDFVINSSPEEIGEFFRLVRVVASTLGLTERGYRLVMNHGEEGGQEIPHFHVHILGGQQLKGL